MSETHHPTNTQQRIARGAIVVCVVMLIWFLSGPDNAVSVTVENGASVYRNGTLLTILPMLIIGALTAALALVFWLQSQFVFRCAGVFLFALSLYMFVNSPSQLRHRVVVSRDHVSSQVRAWYSPTIQGVELKDLAYVQIVDDGHGSAGHRRYALECCNRQTGECLSIPLHDLMRKALPEILRRAHEHDVMVFEYGNGAVLPSSLVEP